MNSYFFIICIQLPYIRIHWKILRVILIINHGDRIKNCNEVDVFIFFKMVYKCSVLNCKSHDKTFRKYTLFSVPADPILNKLWNNVVSENNNKATVVKKICELHFTNDDLVRSYVNWPDDVSDPLEVSTYLKYLLYLLPEKIFAMYHIILKLFIRYYYS